MMLNETKKQHRTSGLAATLLVLSAAAFLNFPHSRKSNAKTYWLKD